MSRNCWVRINPALFINILTDSKQTRRGGGEWDTVKCSAEQEAVKSFSYYWWTEIESRSWGGNDIKPYFITHLDLPTFIHIMGVLQQRQILGKLKGYVK